MSLRRQIALAAAVAVAAVAVAVAVTGYVSTRSHEIGEIKRKRLSHVTVIVAERPASKHTATRKTGEAKAKSTGARKAPSRKAPARLAERDCYKFAV